MAVNRDVYGSLKPFYLILKLFGFACYQIDANTKKLKTAFFDWIWFLASVCLWSGLIWMQVFRDMHKTYKSGIDSPILDSLWRYQFIIQHFFALVVVIFNFWHRESTGKFLKIIFDFDQKIKILRWNDERRSKIFERSIIAFAIGFLILMIYVAIFSMKNSSTLELSAMVYNLFNFNLLVTFYVLLALQFIVGVYCVRSRLAKINDNLR